jgi:hypothetical protein
MLTPVVIQNPTNDHGPHVLREGGRGTVSLFNYDVSHETLRIWELLTNPSRILPYFRFALVLRYY